MFCSLVVSIACIVATLSHGLPTDRLFFYETFNGDDVFATGKFVKFGDAKYADQPVLVKTPKMSPNDMPEDKGLSLSQEMKHYGFGTKFPEPLSMKSQNELVIQYEVKLEETLNCGGAYIKLPQYHVEDVGAMHSETPYTIMFGPDKCGSGTNKVHFILQHKNPITGVYEEKHCTETPSVRSDKKTHLYTLIIRRDNSFEILVDQKSQKKGTLLTDMVPSINPPEEVDDPMDSMPEDWVTEPKMPDPDATKPEDWDEDAPRMIDDPTAVKPAAWLDDAPLKIPDPQYSEKPADWDDEEDGSYEAPLIDNPDCELSGCGQWNPPKIKNPSFKGKWAAPMIDNPAYKGPWAPRKIPNKDYFVDETPAESMTPMGGVAVEVWTVNAGIFFDNFVITHSTDAARNFAEATWVMKAAAENRLEKKEKQKNEKKMQETAKKSGSTVDKALVVAEELSAFVMEVYEENPAGVIATGVATFLLLVMLTCFGTSSASMKEAKVPESETATEELRSGVESTPARALSTVTPDPEPEEPVDESDESDEDGEADDGAEDAEDAEDAEEENAQPEAMPSPPLRRTRAATARARAERAKK